MNAREDKSYEASKKTSFLSLTIIPGGVQSDNNKYLYIYSKVDDLTVNQPKDIISFGIEAHEKEYSGKIKSLYFVQPTRKIPDIRCIQKREIYAPLEFMPVTVKGNEYILSGEDNIDREQAYKEMIFDDGSKIAIQYNNKRYQVNMLLDSDKTYVYYLFFVL